MRTHLLIVITALFLMTPSANMAQPRENVDMTLPPVVVTATRVAVPEQEVGKSVTIVTSENLEQPKPRTLPEALQDVAGIRIQQSGGPGSRQTINIRGVGPRYTQILINGLPVRDAAAPQGDALEFMSDILVEDIEQIEVVRGASSTLYGSDSIGGTINLITKNGTKDSEYYGAFEGGSLSTLQETLGARGQFQAFQYSLTAKRINSKGIDAHDDYKNTSFAGSFGSNVTKDFSFMVYLKYSDATLDLNNSPVMENGILIKDEDDPDDTKDQKLFNGSINIAHQLSQGLDYSVKVGYVTTDRKVTSGPESDEMGYGSTSTFTGKTLNTDVQVNYRLNDANLLTLGGEYETEQFDQKIGDIKETPDTSRYAAYLQDSLSLGALSLVPGVRYMDHDTVGDRFDWEVSTSYLIGESGMRLHGHIGTGFRAPSLYELYGKALFGDQLFIFGNPELEPEESLGFDVGLELAESDNASRLDVTYFSNDFDQIIAFESDGYKNVSGGKSSGVEVETQMDLSESLSIGSSYTYTKTEDANGNEFMGVPKHTVGANITYRILEQLTANLSVTFRSSQKTPIYDPLTYSSVTYQEDGYTKADLVMTYDFSQKVKLWTRIENLLDTNYTENGFKTPGMGVYGGVKLTL